MDINLPSEINDFLQEKVAKGDYASENEAIEEALRLLMAREKLRAELQVGIDQLDRGEWVDGDEVFDEIERELDVLIKKQEAQEGESNAAG